MSLGESLSSAIRSSVTTPDGFVLSGYFIRTDVQRAFAWVVKISFSGTVLFNQTYGYNYWNYANSIIKTGSDDGFLLSGGTIDRSTGNVRQYGDAQIIKLDKAGNLEWVKSFGGIYTDFISASIYIDDDNFIFVGSSEVTATFKKDAYIVKTNRTGGVIWEKRLGGAEGNDDEAYAVTKMENFKGFTILGYTTKNDTEGPLLWAACFDYDGNLIWQKTYGAISSTIAYSKAQIISVNDSLFISASRPSTQGNDGLDILLLKTDSKGLPQWEKSYGGQKDDWVGSIIRTDTGLMMGCTSNSFSMRETNEAWILAVDFDGNPVINLMIGEIGSGLIWSVAKNETNYLVAGSKSSLINGWEIGYAAAINLPTCVPGQYHLLNGSCSLCPVGTWQSQPGMSSCIPCPIGMTGGKYGAITVSDCSSIIKEPILVPSTNPIEISQETTRNSLVSFFVIVIAILLIFIAVYLVKLLSTKNSNSQRIDKIIFYVWAISDVIVGGTNVFTDILYTIFSNFHNAYLFIFAIVFIILPFYLYFGYAVYACIQKDCKTKGIPQLGFSDQILIMIFPFNKYVEIRSNFKSANNSLVALVGAAFLGELKLMILFAGELFDTTQHITFHTQIIEAMFECVPQIIIQAVNSHRMNWSVIALISVCSSSISILYMICKAIILFISQPPEKTKTERISRIAAKVEIFQINPTSVKEQQNEEIIEGQVPSEPEKIQDTPKLMKDIIGESLKMPGEICGEKAKKVDENIVEMNTDECNISDRESVGKRQSVPKNKKPNIDQSENIDNSEEVQDNGIVGMWIKFNKKK